MTHPEPFDKLRRARVEGRSATGSNHVFGAIDIGASSGRVVAGWIADDGLHLEVVHRFPNGVAEFDGHLRWNLSELFRQVLEGLRHLAQRFDRVASLGIDTWAVDYGLLDAKGKLLAEPVAYRDGRGAAAVDVVHRVISPERLYAINGLQFLPFNTVYQLAAEQRGPGWDQARHAVLLPDLLGYWLTGALRTEITNASTTGLLDARTRTWSPEVLAAPDLPDDLFPPLIEPGRTVGTLLPEVAERTGLDRVPVVAVGSHDTASAVVGVPAQNANFAYVSSGTWSLVGLELEAPVLGEASRAANFTNEGGVDARIRYLRNEGGLWLLQESLRTWRDAGLEVDTDELLRAAAALPSGGPTVNVDAAEFLPPGDMPARIRAACADQGTPLDDEPADQAPVAVVRCILDSLANAYARTVAEAEALTGRDVEVIHLVGGGCQNALLCQLTADLSGRPVLAGPVEATATGNVAVQARAAGHLPPSLEDVRIRLRQGLQLLSYQPADLQTAEART